MGRGGAASFVGADIAEGGKRESEANEGWTRSVEIGSVKSPQPNQGKPVVSRLSHSRSRLHTSASLAVSVAIVPHRFISSLSVISTSYPILPSISIPIDLHPYCLRSLLCLGVYNWPQKMRWSLYVDTSPSFGEHRSRINFGRNGTA